MCITPIMSETEPSPDAEVAALSLPESNNNETNTDTELHEVAVTKSKTTKPPFLQRWAHAVHRIGAFIGAKLAILVQFVIHHPKLVIVATILYCLALVGIGVATNFVFETDGDKLWTPTDAYTVRNFDWIEEKSGFLVTPR